MKNGSGEDGLAIGELVERTGVSEGTLRVWERRHGFPVPKRLASGHRRYSESDVELVAGVLRERAAGLSLAAAIARVRDSAGAVEGSIIGPDQVEDITKLPSREELIGRVAALALAPAQRVVGLANAPASGLLGQFKTLAEGAPADDAPADVDAAPADAAPAAEG